MDILFCDENWIFNDNMECMHAEFKHASYNVHTKIEFSFQSSCCSFIAAGMLGNDEWKQSRIVNEILPEKSVLYTSNLKGHVTGEPMIFR